MIYPTVLLYIEPERGYYARYVDRRRTHAVENPDARVPAYTIEALRYTPDTWFPRLIKDKP